MDRVLVTLVVPSLGEQYDVFLPSFLKVKELIPLLAEALTEITGNRYVISGDEILCSDKQNAVLGRERTIKECGIQNSDSVYLF